MSVYNPVSMSNGGPSKLKRAASSLGTEMPHTLKNLHPGPQLLRLVPVTYIYSLLVGLTVPSRRRRQRRTSSVSIQVVMIPMVFRSRWGIRLTVEKIKVTLQAFAIFPASGIASVRCQTSPMYCWACQICLQAHLDAFTVSARHESEA